MDHNYEKGVIISRISIMRLTVQVEVIGVRIFAEGHDQPVFGTTRIKVAGCVVRNGKRKNSTPNIKVGSAISASKIVNLLVEVG